ncbi:hypothetical protein EVAR_99667_1 [Eumeta japonica]|uniref:Uncharacterized protein n=1 Tax=Eumeta variegata TaxID=151549 RepID=A0A4C2A2L4_EUMVA|nr:hypothetical protein EVAR_99667_1 [Eumeta japonica]
MSSLCSQRSRQGALINDSVPDSMTDRKMANENNMIVDIVIPSLLIAVLFIGNAFIVLIIYKYRKRCRFHSALTHRTECNSDESFGSPTLLLPSARSLPLDILIHSKRRVTNWCLLWGREVGWAALGVISKRSLLLAILLPADLASVITSRLQPAGDQMCVRIEFDSGLAQ